MNVRPIALAMLWAGTGTVAVASSSALREIDHTAITDDVCANVVVHANSAIAATLHDDERLGLAVARLRGMDFDDGAPGKRAAVAELSRLAADVIEASKRGGGEARRLTVLASDAPHEHAADLRIFAGALASALDRQSKMGGDLDGFLGSAGIREARSPNVDLPPDSVAAGSFESAGTGSGSHFGGHGGDAPQQPSFSPRPAAPIAMARSVANDLERRMSANVRDETRAAERAEAAVTGC